MHAEYSYGPQITREFKCPHMYLRIELELEDAEGPLTDKVIRAVLSKALTQFLGRQGAATVDVLCTQAEGDGQQGGGCPTVFVRTDAGNVEKVSAACACLSSYGDRRVLLRVVAAAASLAQLAVSSRAYARQHVAPLLTGG